MLGMSSCQTVEMHRSCFSLVPGSLLLDGHEKHPYLCHGFGCQVLCLNIFERVCAGPALGSCGWELDRAAERPAAAPLVRAEPWLGVFLPPGFAVK